MAAPPDGVRQLTEMKEAAMVVIQRSFLGPRIEHQLSPDSHVTRIIYDYVLSVGFDKMPIIRFHHCH